MAEPPDQPSLDRATDPEYASISTWAVVGVVLAALGVAAFLAPPLVAAPLLATVVSAMALRRIRRSRGVETGAHLAVAGMGLGLAIAAASTAYHVLEWLREQQMLEEVRGRALAVADDLAAGRYEKAFDALADDAPQRKAGPAAMRRAMAQRFEGAGALLRRDLMALQIIRTEQGDVMAPADLQVHLERRILAIALLYRQRGDGGWDLVGLSAQETLESIGRFGDLEEPEPAPPPDASPAPGG